MMPPWVQRAIELYQQGWFPMHDHERGVTEWVQPHERALLPLDERFRVPRSTRQAIRRGEFTFTIDHAFERVVRSCHQIQRDGAWLHDDIVTLVLELHRVGLAHSVEAWRVGAQGAPVLVGGLYGLALGRVFAGESMFSLPEQGGTESSKACLVRLVEELRARNFVLLDSQLPNPHLEQFGLYTVPRLDYLQLLREHASPLDPRPWHTPPPA